MSGFTLLDLGSARRKPAFRPTTATVRLTMDNLEERSMMSASPMGILTDKVVAFDVATSGAVSFNLSTGAYSAKIELPSGVSLDTSALKALMNGQFALPKVDPVQALSALGGLKTSVTSNYDKISKDLIAKHGGGNVYVSTERFTDWASPENAASTIGTGIITGGANAGQAIQEAKDVLLGELGNLYTWLKTKIPQEAESILASALKGMVTGTDVKNPYFELKFLNIQQSYTIGLNGVAGGIANGLGTPTSKTVTAVHKGFAVIWQGSGDSLQSLTNSLNKFDGASMSGKSDFTAVLGKIAKRPELKGLGKLADAILTSNPSALADQLVAGKLASALGLTRAQVQQIYKAGNPVLDLTVTQLDEQLLKLLGKLAVGNEGSASIAKLEFNLNTYEITAKVNIRHRHSWGSPLEIINAVGKQIGEWTDKAGNYVGQKLDAAGNRVRDIAYKGADRVTEVFDKAGALLKKTIVNSAGYKTLEATYKNGVKTLETVRDAAGKLLSEYWRDGTKEYRNLYNKGVRTAYTAWDNGVNTVHYVYDAAGKFVSKYWRDGVKEISQTFTNGVVQAETIVQNGVKIAEKAWNGTVQTLNRVRDTAGKMVSDYWRDGTKEFRNLYTNGVRTAYTAWDNGVNTVHYVYDTAGRFVTKYWRDGVKEISQWFTNGVVNAETIVQNGVKIAEKAWKDGVNTLNRVRDTAGNMVSEYWRDGTKEFRNLYTNGVRTAYTIWDNGVNTLHYVYNTAGQFISAYWRDGAREFQNYYKDGVRVAQNVWENGKNIAQHVWNTAGTYVGDALSDAGNTAKGYLGKIGIKI